MVGTQTTIVILDQMQSLDQHITGLAYRLVKRRPLSLSEAIGDLWVRCAAPAFAGTSGILNFLV